MAAKKKSEVLAEDSLSSFNRVDATIQRVKSKLDGRVNLTTADEFENQFQLKRPTGLLSLDLALGGGWAAGTLNQIFGRPGTGKTYLFCRTMAEVQRNYGNAAKIAFASFGYAFDKQFARDICGMTVPYSKGEFDVFAANYYELNGVSVPNELEEELKRKVGELYFINTCTQDSPMEDTFAALIEIIKTGEFQLVVLDEANIGETSDGVSKDLTESERVADAASMTTRFVKKYYGAGKTRSADGKENQTTFIEVLEPRDNINPMSRGGQTQGLGNALRHAKAVDVHLSSWKSYKVGEEEVGKEIEWYIDKGKNGIREGDSGTLIWKHGYGVDRGLDLLFLAEKYDLVVKSGAWYALSTGERIGQGKENASKTITSNQELADNLVRQIIKLSKVKPFTTQ